MKKDFLIISSLVLVLVLVFSFQQTDGKLHLYFLDVGQGDAIFIETPSGKQILIDGGPGNSVLRELGKVMPFFDRTLDMVVVTHPDADHLSGLLYVLERYETPLILETGMDCETSLCAEWESAKAREGSEIIHAVLGQELQIANGVKLLVLNPFESLGGKSLSQTNNGSIVLKLLYGNQSVLLTGDAEKMVENKLIAGNINFDSDFLKIAHHGSKSSSTEEFLREVSPLLAFIQVGRDNKYGHPTLEVINRLADLGIPYYRTDMDGMVELILDGEEYEVKKD